MEAQIRVQIEAALDAERDYHDLPDNSSMTDQELMTVYLNECAGCESFKDSNELTDNMFSDGWLSMLKTTAEFEAYWKRR